MYIYSAKFSILVNGSPRGCFFDASNGLRLVDPLSPLLFIIVTHVLNRMLHLGRQNNLIEGIEFPYHGPEVMNIQYVDDTLIFLEPSDCCIVNLKRILCCFQTYAGLKINFHKSSLIGINIPEALINKYSNMLGCTQSFLPLSYLGLPFHYRKTTYNDWTVIIDKITSKLESWKSKYLSIRGRLTLLNSVLSAVPTYYLLVLHLPVRVEKEIGRLRRRFLWTFNPYSPSGMTKYL